MLVILTAGMLSAWPQALPGECQVIKLILVFEGLALACR